MSVPPDVAERVRRYRPVDATMTPETRHAAVAAVLRHAPAGGVLSAPRSGSSVVGELQVLLMTRAARPDDHWSGQVCLPGGRAEAHDVDLLATAVRETQEEVGLDLGGAAHVLGRLDRVQARARGGPVAMHVTPYVFALHAAPTLQLGDEAAEAFWFPLGRAARGELDAPYRYERGDGTRTDLPSWRFDSRTVWGLTYHMLRRLIHVTSAAT